MTLTDEHEDQADELVDEAPPRTLVGNRVIVHWEDEDLEPIGPIRVTNRDRIAWDKTAPRKKWGAAADVPNLAATFCTWNAAVRQGFTTLSLAAWEEAVAEIVSAPDDEDDARPTRRAARPGS